MIFACEVINYIEQNYYLLIYCTISTIFSTLWIVVINVDGEQKLNFWLRSKMFLHHTYEKAWENYIETKEQSRSMFISDGLSCSGIWSRKLAFRSLVETYANLVE